MALIAMKVTLVDGSRVTIKFTGPDRQEDDRIIRESIKLWRDNGFAHADRETLVPWSAVLKIEVGERLEYYDS